MCEKSPVDGPFYSQNLFRSVVAFLAFIGRKAAQATGASESEVGSEGPLAVRALGELAKVEDGYPLALVNVSRRVGGVPLDISIPALLCVVVTGMVDAAGHEEDPGN